jgi:caffeoyl-CoA O-methyltransferase
MRAPPPAKTAINFRSWSSEAVAVNPNVQKFAHDLSGALSVILTSAELGVTQDGGAASSAKAFGRIQASARRAGELTDELVKAATEPGGTGDALFERDLRYLEGVQPKIHPVLAALEERGLADKIPIVNRDTGRVLGVMAAALRAENILEIGTAYGYSTLWFALSQPETGRILTIDPDRTRTDIAREFWKRADVADRIEVVNQPALAVLAGLPKKHYDIVFIDALKEEYLGYLAAALPLLRTAGLLMADNLLWHHQASQHPQPDDPETTKTIRRFNETFLHHAELNATIIPVGDGVGIGAKTD